MAGSILIKIISETFGCECSSEIKSQTRSMDYIRYFIDMSLCNYLNEETKEEVFWKKISTVFENKNVVNKFLVLRKIVRLRY